MRKLLIWSGVGVLLVPFSWTVFWTLYNPHVEVLTPSFRQYRQKGASGSVLFLGDTAPADKSGPTLAEQGYNYPYSRTKELLASYDVVVANLETPITTSNSPWWLWKKWVYKMPPDALPALKMAGVDALTLANNHIYDYGSHGLRDTISYLDKAEIAHLGAGMSEAEARRGLVIETDGGRLGILSYMEDQFIWRTWTGSFAFDTPIHKWAGAARMNFADLKEDIDRIGSVSDAVVIVMHFGNNYEPITESQTDTARRAIDLGASAVIGHHPHIIQPVAIYKGRPIVYSLGNYVLGSTGNKMLRYGMGAALILRDGNIEKVEITPFLTQNRLVHFRPYVPTGKRLKLFFDKVISESSKHNTELVRSGSKLILEVPRPDSGHSSE